MNNFFNTVLEVLKQNENYFSQDDELLRNAVYEDAMKMEPSLISLLYKNEVTRERFSQKWTMLLYLIKSVSVG